MAVKKLNRRKIFLGEKQTRNSFSLRKAKEQSLESLSNNNDVSNLLNKLIDKVDSLGKNSFVNDDYIYKNLKKEPDVIYILNSLIQYYFYRSFVYSKNENLFFLNKYFMKKMDNINKFNLDMDSFFIEFRKKILNG